MSRVYGERAVEELLATAPSAISQLLVARGQAERLEPLMERARALGIAVVETSELALKQRAGGRGGAVVGAEIRIAQTPDLEDIASPTALVVALDGVTDPHNLGAVIRSAAAFGAAAVIVPKHHSAPLTDAAVRASAGAVAHIPLLRVTNMARSLRALRDGGLWIYATLPGATQILWDTDLTGGVGLVLGAEGRGVRAGVIKACDLSIGLPLPGPIGSLNVSVFAGLALAEAARQRRAAG